MTKRVSRQCQTCAVPFLAIGDQRICGRCADHEEFI